MSQDGLHTPPRQQGVLTSTAEHRADVFDKLRPVLLPTYEALGRGLEKMGSAMSGALGSLGRLIIPPSYDPASVDTAICKLEATRGFLDTKITEMRRKNFHVRSDRQVRVC